MIATAPPLTFGTNDRRALIQIQMIMVEFKMEGLSMRIGGITARPPEIPVENLDSISRRRGYFPDRVKKPLSLHMEQSSIRNVPKRLAIARPFRIPVI
jgi:hypothetical protein